MLFFFIKNFYFVNSQHKVASKCKMQISEHVLFIGNLERVLQIKAL